MVAERTLLDFIRAGGPWGYLIILLALAGVALVIAFALTIRRSTLLPPLLVSQLEQTLNSGDVGEARELCVKATALRNVLFAGLARLDDGPDAAARAAHLATERVRLGLRRYTGWLLLLTTTMLLVGMAGTVGMFVKFYTRLVLMKGVTNIADLWDGYIGALAPGYTCLSFAVLLFPAWWFFSARAEMLAHEIEMTAEDLISRVGSEPIADDQAKTEARERE